MPIRFLESEAPTQILLIAAVSFVAWLAVWQQKPKYPQFRALHVEKINFLLVVWFVGTIGSFLYSLLALYWPIFIVAIASIAWNLTALAVLFVLSGNRVIRILAALPILSVLILLPKYDFDFGAFATDLDRVVMCGPAIKLRDCPAAGLPAGSTKQSAAQKEDTSVEFGGVRARPSSVARGGYFFLSLFLILLYYGQIYRAWHEDRDLDPMTRALDASVVSVLTFVFSSVISIIVGLFFAGADLPSLAVISGILVGAVSFVLRDILQNSIAGLLLVWDKTIEKNDVITVGTNQYGYVERIGVRYTSVKDRNDINTLIPNSKLISDIVQNWTQNKQEDGKSTVRVKLDIGVAYSTDVNNAIARLVQASRRVKRVLSKPAPQALVMGMGDSAINLQLRFWINDPQGGIRNVMSQVYLQILDEFAREDPKKITIPFPQREVHVFATSERETTAFKGE